MYGLPSTDRSLMGSTGDDYVRERVAETFVTNPQRCESKNSIQKELLNDVPRALNGDFMRSPLPLSRSGLKIDPGYGLEGCMPISDSTEAAMSSVHDTQLPGNVLERSQMLTTLLPLTHSLSGVIRLSAITSRRIPCSGLSRCCRRVTPTYKACTGEDISHSCRSLRRVGNADVHATDFNGTSEYNVREASSPILSLAREMRHRFDIIEEILHEQTRTMLRTNDLMNLSFGGVCLANSDLTITAEEYLEDEDDHLSSSRSGREVHSFQDDFSEVPVFIFRVNRKIRFRISWNHRLFNESQRWSLRALSVQPDDGFLMQYREGDKMIRTGEQEVIVHFDPVSHESRKLGMASPQCGETETKYVKLRMQLEFGNRFAFESLTIPRDVYCKMVAENSRMTHLDVKRTILKGWRQCPQWFRNRARETVSVGKTAVPLVSLLAVGDPSGAALVLKGLKCVT